MFLSLIYVNIYFILVGELVITKQLIFFLKLFTIVIII